MSNAERPAAPDPRPSPRRVIALSGGVGGAKLALGLYRVLAPDRLVVIGNVGDDFEHLGLRISPDLDTLMYTLAGVANPETGWGRAGETWTFMRALEQLGGPTWFRLGDGDLATHVERTRRLARGETLSAVTTRLCARLGVAAALVPASDDPLRTVVETEAGPLPFQHYFVRDRCVPRVTGLRFAGAEAARPSPALIAALADGVEMIVICPSNPLISIDPILAVPGLRRALIAARAPIVAVSPIIAGRAVKGPTVKMMDELGMPCDPIGVAEHYRGLIDGLVIDEADAGHSAAPAVPCHVTRTLMRTVEDRERLAREVLAFAARVAEARIS